MSDRWKFIEKEEVILNEHGAIIACQVTSKNGPLIAAAPAMLEALKDMVEAGSGTNSGGWAAWKAANHAINQAEGKD